MRYMPQRYRGAPQMSRAPPSSGPPSPPIRPSKGFTAFIGLNEGPSSKPASMPQENNGPNKHKLVRNFLRKGSRREPSALNRKPKPQSTPNAGVRGTSLTQHHTPSYASERLPGSRAPLSAGFGGRGEGEEGQVGGGGQGARGGRPATAPVKQRAPWRGAFDDVPVEQQQQQRQNKVVRFDTQGRNLLLEVSTEDTDSELGGTGSTADWRAAQKTQQRRLQEFEDLERSVLVGGMQDLSMDGDEHGGYDQYGQEDTDADVEDKRLDADHGSLLSRSPPPPPSASPPRTAPNVNGSSANHPRYGELSSYTTPRAEEVDLMATTMRAGEMRRFTVQRGPPPVSLVYGDDAWSGLEEMMDGNGVEGDDEQWTQEEDDGSLTGGGGGGGAAVPCSDVDYDIQGRRRTLPLGRDRQDVGGREDGLEITPSAHRSYYDHSWLEEEREEAMGNAKPSYRADSRGPTAVRQRMPGTPPTSNLVSRVFGAAVERPTDGRLGDGPRLSTQQQQQQQHEEKQAQTLQRPQGSAVGEEDGCKRCGVGGPLMQRVEAKIAELDREAERCRKEADGAVAARKKHDTLNIQLEEKKREVEVWAEAERVNTIQWCEEQKQVIAKEKKALVRQQARVAQLEQQLRANPVPTRQERAEVEALKATVEKMKIEEDARRRKATMSQKRQAMVAKEQQARIVELEEQLAFLERQRVDIWERQLAIVAKNTNGAQKKKSGLVGGVSPLAAAPAAAGAAAGKVGAAASRKGFTHAPIKPLPTPPLKPIPSAQQQSPAAVEASPAGAPDGIVEHDSNNDQNSDEDFEGGVIEEVGNPEDLSLPLAISSSSSCGGHKRKRGMSARPADGVMESSFISNSTSHDMSSSSLSASASFPPPLSDYDPSKYTGVSARLPPCAPQHSSATLAPTAPTVLRAPPSFGSVFDAPAQKARDQAGVLSTVRPPQSSHQQASARQQLSPQTFQHLQQHQRHSPSVPPAPNGGLKSGRKVVRACPDGRQAIWYANGTYKEVLPNGKAVVSFANGDVKTTETSGAVIYYYASADTTHTTYPDGLEVYQFPTGQLEKHFPDGSKEIYLDGPGGQVVRHPAPVVKVSDQTD